MTIFGCVNCGQSLTGEVALGEPLKGPEVMATHKIVSPRMAVGTFQANFDASLLILHPDDVPGMAPHPDSRRLSGCCGVAGQDGPNLVCGGCDVEVATKESDCWTNNLVALIVAATDAVGVVPFRSSVPDE
ncbi:hypothetical protein [Streptomyces sp. SID3212]|uniref:hypothetical protein n=1 Tax=Streptomyces sp. SID3212 TaxID=2690259 RepID=UPI00136DDF98|nr:hypothetical protein [Streptomyces sp. SID3212]MYV51841.1 hypothetical protein [Streptomyces sp. SID3212]